MASLYKRSGSKVWQCAFYVSHPETGEKFQVRKSTGMTSRSKAVAVAVELEKAEKEVCGGGDDRSRRIQAVLVKVGEDAVRGTLNAAVAREFLAEILKISTGEDLPAFTVRTWLDEWERRKRATVSLPTAKRYAVSARTFITWLGERADRPLESVTTTDVRAFRDALRAGGRAARTCNHYVKDLGSGYRMAVREGLILKNPASALEALPTDDSIDRQPFTRGEVSRILGVLPSEDWRGFILVAVFTGLRLADVAKLRWGSVDLASGCIQVIPSKTKRKKRKVLLPLHSDLRDFLENHPISDDPEAFVFPSLAKVSISGQKGLSLTFAGFMAVAEVSRGESRKVEPKGEDGLSSPSVGRTTHARGFHSLRHTFTSWLANEDVSEELRMKMTGHSDSRVHQGYSHHELETLARAVDRLQSLQ